MWYLRKILKTFKIVYFTFVSILSAMFVLIVWTGIQIVLGICRVTKVMLERRNRHD